MNANPTGHNEVHATFDGEPISCAPGASVAAALIATGRTGWRTTREGATRGLFCGIGICFDCLVEIDGESGQRSCMIPLAEGMEVRSARGATSHGSGPASADRPADSNDAGSQGAGSQNADGASA